MENIPKFDNNDKRSAIDEFEDIERDKIEIKEHVDFSRSKEEIEEIIQNPESIKDEPFSELADLLNKAHCMEYGPHPLKDIIDKIIEERYPYSKGWVAYGSGTDYFNTWVRDKDGKQIGIQYVKDDEDVGPWYGYEK